MPSLFLFPKLSPDSTIESYLHLVQIGGRDTKCRKSQ
ncbi:hypothetical protein [Bacillus phage vB_BceS-M2]